MEIGQNISNTFHKRLAQILFLNVYLLLSDFFALPW